MTVLSLDGIGAYVHVHRSVDDVQCWTFRVSRNCSPSCGRHIPNRHGTHGKTVKARGIGFGSTKVESKVTPSCRSSSVWRSTTLLLRCVGTCARENSCSHTSMTCKSFQSQTAPAHFTSCCLTDCTPWQGIQLQTGKTLTWNAAGECPPGMAQLGTDVWSPRGVILGTPVGTDDFVQTKIESWRTRGCCGRSCLGS